MGWGPMGVVRAAGAGHGGAGYCRQYECVEQVRHDSLRWPPIGFAHRGASAHASENTLEAFTLAVSMGATGLESDVWATADGIPVLDHDGRIGRRPRRRPISAVPRVALDPHIPTLAELYEAVGTGLELSLDIKDAAALQAVIDVARTFAAEARLWLVHGDWRVLATWRDRTSARLVESTRIRSMKEGPERRAASLRSAGVDAVNLPADDWSGGLTALFHRFDRYCLGWGATHRRQIEALVRMGVDGVYSDHVDRLMEVIGS
jgi:glycerophosphoryl diester phosphodiesterase